MREVKVNGDVLNSLIFFCFGFNMKDNKEHVINKVVQKAYFDATNQGAFNAKPENKNKDKKTIKENTCKLLSSELLKYKLHDTKDVFNEWHTTLCDKVIEESNFLFSYGNAQKLVNMSMKYLYMLSFIEGWQDSSLIKILNYIKSDEELLHIPVDSYIIDAAFKKYEGEAKAIIDEDDSSIKKDLIKKDAPKKKKISECSRPSDYIVGWSTWKKEQYDLFQRKLNKGICWEMEAWVRAAKDRKE